MTKINIYCLFYGEGSLHGVYSSLKAAHRDALKICNQSNNNVLLEVDGEYTQAKFAVLRNLFQGESNIKVRYTSGDYSARIVKTKLKE
tara:strand:+ start:5402 stop:5665 length:264 start_codon:yes stop_codon:yes gene_type:complete